MRTLVVFLAAAIMSATAAFAGGPPPTSYAAYLRLLYENHPELKSLKAERDAKSRVPDQESALPNPQLTLGIMDVPADTFSLNQEDMTRKVIGVSQSFPAPGKRELRRKAAENDVEAADAMLGEKRLELAEQTRLAFYQLRYLYKSRETVMRNKEILREFVETALTRYSTGFGMQQDVLAAQIEFSRMVEMLIRTEQEISVASSNLDVWAGLPSDTDWRRLEISTIQSFEAEEDTLAKTAVKKRPLFRQLDAGVRKSDNMLQLARKELLPDYSVSLSYGVRENGAMPRSNLISAEVMLDIPLYRNKRQEQMVSQSVMMEEKARQDLEAEKLRLRRDVVEQLQMQRGEEQLLELYDTGLLPQARQSVEAAISAYRVNKVDFRWLVMNQAALFDYEQQKLKIEFELLSSRTRLERMLGNDGTEVQNEY